MPTSSITHNFVISKPDSVKRFVDAIDEAERDRTPKQTLPDYYGIADQQFRFSLIINSDTLDQSFRLG